MKLKILFFPITLILSLSILIWFVKPMWSEYKTSQGELATATKQKEDLDKGLRQLNMSMDAYEIMDEDSKQLIKNAITDEKNNDDFIAEIHKNVVNSGIFLGGSQLKEERVRTKVRKTGDEEGYIKVEKKGTVVKVEVVGKYTDIKSFIDKVDIQNRFTAPKEVLISSMDEDLTAEDNEVDVVGELVKGSITFVIYDKEVDVRAKISKLSSMNDPIVKSLLTDGLKTKVVDDYRNSITSTLFKPVIASGSGKEDLFAK